MVFSEAVDAFLTYCELERALSPNTLIAYAQDLKSFRGFAETSLGPLFCPDDVGRSLVRGFIADLRKRGLSIPTIHRRLCCLRSLWTFLVDVEGATADSPLEGLRLPKAEHRVPAYLTEGEMRDLLAAARDGSRRWLGVRDEAVLSTFVFAGLRRTELLRLRMADLRLQERVLTVNLGKGSRSRVIPIAPTLASVLAEWFGLRPECDHDHVFCNQMRGPLGRHALQHLFEKAKFRAGIDRPGILLHALRHSFACALLQGGTNVVAIQHLLGHASLETTAIYLHVSGQELREAVGRHVLCHAGAESPAFARELGPWRAPLIESGVQTRQC